MDHSKCSRVNVDEAQISESLSFGIGCEVEEKMQGHRVHNMLQSPLIETTSDERNWSGKGRRFMGLLVWTTFLFRPQGVAAKSMGTRAGLADFNSCLHRSLALRPLEIYLTSLGLSFLIFRE